MNRLPRWRIAAAAVVLAGLIGFLAMFAPIYFRNMRLQSYVSEVTQNVENAQKPDDLLRTWVLDRAHELSLPVAADNVQAINVQGHAGTIDKCTVCHSRQPDDAFDHRYSSGGN